MIGKITNLGEVKKLSEGLNKKGTPWILWGVEVEINGERLSVSGFDIKQVEGMIEGLNPGDTVEYKVEQKGRYLNITELMKTDKEFTPASEVKVPEVNFEQKAKDLLPLTSNLLDALMDNTSPEMLDFKMRLFFELLKEQGLYERTKMIQGYKQGNMKAFRRN